MPRKRRSQSPAEAAEVQNLAKRQQSESEGSIKANVESRPGSVRVPSRISLAWGEWTVGLPLPASLVPPEFIPSSQFQPQAAMPLDDDEKKGAIEEWISSEYKSRPRFARLLYLEWLEEGNDELLAAYLGFNTVPQLYYFMHFQGEELLLLLCIVITYADPIDSPEPVDAFNSDIPP